MAKETKIQQSPNIDKEAKVAADAAIGVGKAGLKVGAMFLAHLNGGPAAAVGTAIITELASVLLAQRQARLTSFWEHLFNGCAHLPADRRQRFDENVATPQGEQLLEFAWQQAAEEVELEKVEALASLLVNGLSSDELKSHQTRWLLELLGRVDAVQILILKAHTQSYRNDKDFWEKHANVLASDDPGKPPYIPFRPVAQPQLVVDPETSEAKPGADEEWQRFYQERDAHNVVQEKADFKYQIEREKYAIFRVACIT